MLRLSFPRETTMSSMSISPSMWNASLRIRSSLHSYLASTADHSLESLLIRLSQTVETCLSVPRLY